MQFDNNIQAFFALVKAGLWEKETQLLQYKNIDYSSILKLAEEQSVVGLVTAGFEKVEDVKVPKEVVLQFVGRTLQIEQRNQAMNEFVARLIEKLRAQDVYALLVKGQGVAQCYERPMWRSSGDIDLLLSHENYEKAKTYLVPLADRLENEFVIFKHYGMTIKGWEVELHGTLCPRLTNRIDKAVDDVQRDVFYNGNVRSWMNGNVQIFIPGPNEDVIFQITHILKHFYQGGIGLRQICDLCRFLWTFREKMDKKQLEGRLRSMGIMTEWKAFCSFAVDYLGMPIEVTPFYSSDKCWKKKAKKICDFILEVGNFGHNRDHDIQERPFVVRKTIALWQRTTDCFRHFWIFPKNSLKVWLHVIKTGLVVAASGK